WPVAASHTRTVLSKLVEATCLPSGEKATVLTMLVWPLRTTDSWAAAVLHDPASRTTARDCQGFISVGLRESRIGRAGIDSRPLQPPLQEPGRRSRSPLTPARVGRLRRLVAGVWNPDDQ